MICNCCIKVNAQIPSVDSSTNSTAIIRIEQSLMDAIAFGDTTLWSKYLDKDFFIVTEDGTRFIKKSFLESFQPLPKGFTGNIKIVQPKVIFHDNIAVIAYVADENEWVYGQHLHTTYGTLNTYYKNDTSWTMLASEIYEIPQLPPPIKAPAATLKQYCGKYQMNNTISCTVSYERDTLFIQKKNA